MEIRVNKKTYEIKEYTSFKQRFKSLKFVFEPLDFIIKIPNKKLANTYFFVQKVDIFFTDKKNRIIRIVEEANTEKFFFEKTATHVYYLPLGFSKEYRINDILK